LLIAGVAHLLVYLFLSRRFPLPKDRSVWKHAIFLGAFGTAIPMTCIVMSLQYLSSGVSSTLLTLGPAVIVILAHYVLPDESLNRRKAVGVTIAFAGALVLAASGQSGISGEEAANPLGYILIFTAIFIANGMTVYSRKYMKDFDAYDVASIRMWAAALTVLPLSIIMIGMNFESVTTVGYLGLLYAALIGTFAGLLLAFYNIKRFGATASAMTAYVIPVVAGIGGVLFLDEQITAVMLTGMALIIIGIAVLQSKKSIAAPELVINKP
ncbi:MAG: DMT family transporter, partial [Anaerolineae bacterium]|nr:DMT family transporter [Anaerolineae bacterium]